MKRINNFLRPSQKNADNLVIQVMGSIKSVDTKLSDQIKYLTQVSTGEETPTSCIFFKFSFFR